MSAVVSLSDRRVPVFWNEDDIQWRTLHVYTLYRAAWRERWKMAVMTTAADWGISAAKEFLARRAAA